MRLVRQRMNGGKRRSDACCEEREPMVFWDEGAHRGGCRKRAGAYGDRTSANVHVHDIAEAHHLIREDDEVVYGDAGYRGIEKRDEIERDEHLKGVEWRIAKRPGKIKEMKQAFHRWCDVKEEYLKAKVRSKVEHAFHIMKCIFGFRKVCYRGIEKNLNRLFMLFSQVNVLKMARAGVCLR